LLVYAQQAADRLPRSERRYGALQEEPAGFIGRLGHWFRENF
jgi:hypothetical protein